MSSSHNFAIVGAGIAGIACARTLERAGHQVTVFEKNPVAGGRMASCETPFGSFDYGAQYFTVRDPRLARAMETTPYVCKRWSANAIRVLDPFGQVVEAPLPGADPHWVAAPTMDALVAAWAAPLMRSGAFMPSLRVHRIERDAITQNRWQLQAQGVDGSQRRFAGFDAVLLALPASAAQDLLRVSGLAPALVDTLSAVTVAPCWSLMLAFPQAQQPGMSRRSVAPVQLRSGGDSLSGLHYATSQPSLSGLTHFGPQWNAARSIHHRLAWLCRESSKPGRNAVERWTAQASVDWSQEHLEDDSARVLAKLQKAFSEVTGIRAQPSHAEVYRWRSASTLTPLGQSHLWDAGLRIGLAGDWCLGHRVEDAFVSGLELALAVL